MTPPRRPAVRRTAGFAFTALLLTATAGVRAADNALALADIRSAITYLVNKEMSAKDVVGLSLALVDDQKIIWAEGFGFADKERRRPAHADTMYAVGDLSQLLTATAVLQWVDRDAAALDQPIQRHVPEFFMRTRDGQPHAITVRQLLSHHAGLPAMHLRGMWTPAPEPLATFVARLKNETAPFPPNLFHAPSFPGYDVLGRLIEKHCGQSFARCLKEHTLEPLGMKHATFQIDSIKNDSYAMHYWSGKPVPSQVVRDVPASGLASSATELAHLAQMLFAQGRYNGRQVLSARSAQEMLHAQNTKVALDLGNHVALPWRLAGVRFAEARTVAWLNNESPFARGRMLLVPEHKLAVVVLTNCSGSTPAVEKISERLMELVLQARKLPPAPAAVPTLTASASPLHRDDVVGHYATKLGLISVSATGQHYQARLLGRTVALRPAGDGLLAPQYHLLGFIPIPLEALKEARLSIARVGGQPHAVAYYRQQTRRLGDRIQPVTLNAAWQRRLGEYTAMERDPLLNLVKMHNVRLAHNDGILQFRYRIPGWLGLMVSIPVRPVSDTELVVEGTGWLMGDSVQVVPRQGQEALRYSGYEFRQVGRP